MKMKLLLQKGIEPIVQCEPKPGEAFPCGKHPLLSALQPQRQHDSTMLKMHFQSKNKIQINKAVVFNSIFTNTNNIVFMIHIFVLCLIGLSLQKKFVKFILHFQHKL